MLFCTATVRGFCGQKGPVYRGPGISHWDYGSLFSPVLGHTLWIQSSIGYNIMPGRKTNIFFGWGHHLPVHDPICSLGKQWVKEYTIYEPDGNVINEAIDGEKNGGFMNIPYVWRRKVPTVWPLSFRQGSLRSTEQRVENGTTIRNHWIRWRTPTRLKRSSSL